MKTNTKSILLLALAWAAGTRADIGLETVSDVRVGPLLATRWNQAFDTGYSNVGEPCYNYYLEGNKSGCSATALAQILRYWEFPSDVVAQTFLCWAGPEEMPLETRGGAFAWVVRKQISFVKAIKTSWKYFVAGSVMFITVFSTQHFLTPSPLYTCLLVLEGIAIYALMLLLLKDSAFLSIGKNILSRLKRKKQSGD